MEDEGFPIKLTEKAVIAVKEVATSEGEGGKALRVGIRGGGCAGFSYSLDFGDAKETDLTTSFDGLTVVIDPISAMHLEGTTIDYVSGLLESGFRFINPHAKHTCGCGSSFTD